MRFSARRLAAVAGGSDLSVLYVTTRAETVRMTVTSFHYCAFLRLSHARPLLVE